MSYGYLHPHSEMLVLGYGFRLERMDQHQFVVPPKVLDSAGMQLCELVVEVEEVKIQCRRRSTAPVTVLSTGLDTQKMVLEMGLLSCIAAVADTGLARAAALMT